MYVCMYVCIVFMASVLEIGRFYYNVLFTLYMMYVCMYVCICLCRWSEWQW